MSRFAKARFLEDQLRVLVTHFGAAAVHRALGNVAPATDAAEKEPSKSLLAKGKKRKPRFEAALDKCLEEDPRRHAVLTDLRAKLRDRRLLPESQDIRHFAHIAGLKNIKGKSRRELVSALLRSILDMPTVDLVAAVEKAGGISESARRNGFSVLVDKLASED